MIDIAALTQSVQTNCHISDAQFAGNYSLCTFLLKMREYYRWEQQLPLSEKLAKSDVGAWISQRESDWEQYEHQEFCEIPLPDQPVNPFDASIINDTLNQHGYVYSGGYGVFGKPNFVLAELAEKQTIENLSVYIAEKEFARDLAAPPAMINGNAIFIRRESLRRFLWEKIEEWKWKNDPLSPMGRTLDFYKTTLNTQDYEAILDAMCVNETRSTLYHEIGEAKAGELLGDAWKSLLAELPRSTLELKLRAIKDHLADSISTLPTLIDEENHAALHFYFANLTGMRKEIFPEAHNAYQEWLSSKQLSTLTQLCKMSYDKWTATANNIVSIYRNNREHWQQVAEKTLAG